jgi:hypothetical protein
VVAEPTVARRSVALRLMAGLGNAYLIAFAIDAVLSLLDDGLRLTAGEQPALHAARNAVGFWVLAASLPVPLLLLFVPHLPRLPFVLPLAFILSFLTGSILRVVSIDWLSAVQVVVAALSFWIVEARTGAWLLSAERLPRKRWLFARTAFAAIVTLVVLPLAAAALVAFGFLTALEHETGNYLDLTASGIDVRESVLTKDGRTVRLVAMAHYGEQDFYRALFDEMPPRSLVLAEGITDREKRLKGFPSLSRIAKTLGLTSQPNPAAIRSRVLDAAGANGSAAPTAAERPDVVVADVDVSQFSETTLDVLHELADLYGGDTGEALRRLLRRARTTKDLALFKTEVVDERNDHVLSVFDAKAPTYDTIVIPWGALHMPGLEAGLLERGYRIETQRSRPVIRFETIATSLAGG